MSKRVAHLNIIQGVINRLSQNSFLLKGWSVILISALLALFFNNEVGDLKYLLFFPNLAFWFLDAYFLERERLFRDLYNEVRKLPENKIDFSMKIKKDKFFNIIKVMLSRTLIIFHGAIFLIIIVFINNF